MTREEIEDLVFERYGDEHPILMADGFDEACLGIIERSHNLPILAYDYWKAVDIVLKDLDRKYGDDMDVIDAEDYLEANVLCMYSGPYTPAFIYR